MRTRECNGYRSSGYWKGHPCGASANYELDGKWYCANHYAVALKDKELAKAIITQDDMDHYTNDIGI